MAVDGVEVRITGVDDAIKQLRALPAKLRKRAILNALRAGARLFRDEARRLTPVITVPVRRRGVVVRNPGTVRKAISVRTSKRDRRAGDVGVFVNVRPAKKGARGANSPTDPFYWRWLEFGFRGRAGVGMLQTSARKGAEALRVIIAKLGPAVQKIVSKQASE
jgi:HK97 gp10 family phage protein